MLAHLYLHSNFLRHNGSDTEEMVADKLKTMAEDFVKIKSLDAGNNIVHTGDGIYKIDLYPGKKLIPLCQQYLDREERTLMLAYTYNSSPQCDLKLSDLLKICVYSPEETVCHAAIIFNHTDNTFDSKNYLQFEQYNIVYGIQSWYHLRQQILGNHPGNVDEFKKSCIKFFPNLFFDNHSWVGIEPYLSCIPRKIVYHLTCMNDFLRDFYDKSDDKAGNTVLGNFSMEFGFEKKGSLQRDQDKKPLLMCKFNYLDSNQHEREKELCCECHFKINSFDDNYIPKQEDKKDEFRARIYFHFGDPEIQNNRVLIYQIGPHV